MKTIHMNIIYQEQVFDNQGTIHKAYFDYKLQILSFRIIEKRREEDVWSKDQEVDKPQAKSLIYMNMEVWMVLQLQEL